MNICKSFLAFLGLVCQINYALQAQQTKHTTAMPNIILVMADDMGYECVGSNGNVEYATRHLDAMAAGGIRFTNCYSQPLCTPSRVKIMTGKHNYRNYEKFGYLNPNQTTFGNLLKQAGYATCISGKWQLNGIGNYPDSGDLSRPNHFGFDEYCLWQLNHRPRNGERYTHPLITQNGKDLPRDPESYGPDIFSDYVCDFIKRNADRPFFIYYPMVLTHDPFVPTPESPAYADAGRRNERDTAYFADMVAYTDKIMQKIDDALAANGVRDNTILIFTADNGTHRPIISSTINGDITGGKGKTINTGNHVPLIVKWPTAIRKGRVYEGMIDFSDFLPTFAEAAGIDPSSYITDGTSFYTLLEGKSFRPKKEVFIHYTPRAGGFQHNRWVLNSEYKLYRDGRFYNTRVDPDEKQSLPASSGKEKRIKKKLEKVLKDKENEFPFELNNTEFRVSAH